MAEKRKRRPMAPVSEAAQEWAEALRAELEEWPEVRVQRSFGMILVYRADMVFAALPSTRALHGDDAIMLKFQEEKPALVKRMAADARFASARLGSARNAKSEGRKWRFFLLRGDGDVHAAIEWLAEAYRAARKRRA